MRFKVVDIDIDIGLVWTGLLGEDHIVHVCRPFAFCASLTFVLSVVILIDLVEGEGAGRIEVQAGHLNSVELFVTRGGGLAAIQKSNRCR